MPGTSYNYEKGFIFELSSKYRVIANELLSREDLAALIYIYKNLDSDEIKVKFEIKNPIEWVTLMKAVIVAKITYFEVEVCSKKEIFFLIKLLSEVALNGKSPHPQKLSNDLKKQYPVLTSWLTRAEKRILKINNNFMC